MSKIPLSCEPAIGDILEGDVPTPVCHQLVKSSCGLVICAPASPSFSLLERSIKELPALGGVHEAFHACRAATVELHLRQERSFQDLTGLLLDPRFLERWCTQRHAGVPSLRFTPAGDRAFFLQLLKKENPLCFAIRQPASQFEYLSAHAPGLNQVIVLLVLSLQKGRSIAFEGLHLPGTIEEFRRLIGRPKRHMLEFTRLSMQELISARPPLETFSCFYSLVAYWSLKRRGQPFSTQRLPSRFQPEDRPCTGLALVEERLGHDQGRIAQFFQFLLGRYFVHYGTSPSGSYEALCRRYQTHMADIYGRISRIMRIYSMDGDLASLEEAVQKLLEGDLKAFLSLT